MEDGTDTGVEVENVDTVAVKIEEERVDEGGDEIRRGAGRDPSLVIMPTGANTTLGRRTCTGLTAGREDVEVDVDVT